MKKLIFAAFVLIQPLAHGRASVELPAWETPTEASAYYLGGGLWPKTLIPDATAAVAEPGPATPAAGEAVVAEAGTTLVEIEFVGPPAPGQPQPGPIVVAVADASQARFYGPQGSPDEGRGGELSMQRVRENPDGTFYVPEEIVEEEAYEPLPPLEGALADLYFAHAPIDYLIDPQRLLTEQKSNDIMRFLEFHADESKIRIFVMALGETQKVPDDVNLEELHEKWFSDNPTVLMLYYREKPELTELVFNANIRNTLPVSVFERIRQNCLREGAVADLAPDQVEKMAIELSIQLYWLSRLIASENKDSAAINAAATVHELMASSDAPELLREYAPGIFIDESGKVLTFIVSLVFIIGGLAMVGAIAWVAMWWRGREVVSGEPLLFPEIRIARRLGGEFSGGGFVGMSFEIGEGA